MTACSSLQAGICAHCSLLLLTLVGAPVAHAQLISGRIVDAYSGDPMPGVVIILTGTLHATSSGADGYFRLGPVPAGRYNLAATHFGYREVRWRIFVRSGTSLGTLLRLEPEHREVPVAPSVGSVAHHPAERWPPGLALATLPELHLARRSLVDLAPLVRGMAGAQVGVTMDGAEHVAGSPLGPLLIRRLQPFALEVAPGPYALAWSPGTHAAVRVRTAIQDGVAAEAGYTAVARSYGAAAVAGRARPVLAYEFSGMYGVGDPYEDATGTAPLAAVGIRAVKGRARVRGRGAELSGWASYAARPIGAGQGITQWKAGARLAQGWRHPVVRAIEAGVQTHVRSLDAWPQSASAAHREQHLGGRARLHLVPAPGLRMLTGIDASRTRLGDDALTQAGIFVYGSSAKAHTTLSGAIRMQAALPNGQESVWLLSAAAGMEMSLSDQLQLTLKAGTAGRPAGVYERFAHSAPSVRMPFSVTTRGRSTLVAERSLQADAELRREASSTTMLLRLFAQRLWNEIGVDAQGQFANMDAVVYGGECTVARRLAGEVFEVRVGGGLLHGLRRLPLMARAVAVVRLPADLLRLELGLRGASSARLAARADSVRVGSYLVLDLRLRVKLPHGLSLVAGVENVTDQRYGLYGSGLWQHARVLPESGRQWTILLRRDL